MNKHPLPPDIAKTLWYTCEDFRKWEAFCTATLDDLESLATKYIRAQHEELADTRWVVFSFEGISGVVCYIPRIPRGESYRGWIEEMPPEDWLRRAEAAALFVDLCDI